MAGYVIQVTFYFIDWPNVKTVCEAATRILLNKGFFQSVYRSKMNANQLLRLRISCQSPGITANSSRSISGWMDRKKRKFFDLNVKEEPTFFSETEPNPLADIERRIEASKQKLVWRKPVAHTTTFLTEGLRFLAPERTKHFFEILQRPFDKDSLQKTIEYKMIEMRATDQRFMIDRHRILGNDLAAAHFLVARGGQVR